jgi:hypothetical protein
MILTKDVLLRKLDNFELELGQLRDKAKEISEELRGVEEVDTDTWCVLDWWAETEINRLAADVAALRRDVLTDL